MVAGGRWSWSRWPASTSCGLRPGGAPRSRRAAGTTNEGLRDGPVDQAWFAQTSGLAVTTDADGERLWLADSETSSLRRSAPAS